MVFREFSFSRLECGVHDRLHIYPLCRIFYFPWHRHQIEGTNGFYCLIRKTERFTISNVESQVFTPNNSRLDPGSNPGCPRDKRMSYHWTNCASLYTGSNNQRISRRWQSGVHAERVKYYNNVPFNTQRLQTIVYCYFHYYAIARSRVSQRIVVIASGAHNGYNIDLMI